MGWLPASRAPEGAGAGAGVKTWWGRPMWWLLSGADGVQGMVLRPLGPV